MPANDSIAHKGRTVLSALNYKLNALCNVALYHDTPYGETHKNQLQRYYTTIYCDCQVRKVYIDISGFDMLETTGYSHASGHTEVFFIRKIDFHAYSER